ncbi:MAG TPA: TetR/AcrR family transcriptional regulator [Bryobacteraceae bacterium]|nr:TetR/AcrR family transcriptional regulator [Bryobacteraceae bacterium]
MARTPSKEAHDKVLSAALNLIAERGIEATSMDSIAAASGVSKATVYKHWANKDALLIDVLRTHWDQLPEFNSGNPRKDMAELLGYMAEAKRREELGPVWPRIIGYAASNPKFAKAMQEFAFEPRRLQIQRIIGEAARKGELRDRIDAGLATDLLIGPVMHRRFSGNKVSSDIIRQIVDYFWEVFRR